MANGMTDEELVKRLRTVEWSVTIEPGVDETCANEAADCIEELEAKLAKAMDALDWIGNHMVMSMALNESGLITSMKQRARTTLAELKGEK